MPVMLSHRYGLAPSCFCTLVPSGVPRCSALGKSLLVRAPTKERKEREGYIFGNGHTDMVQGAFIRIHEFALMEAAIVVYIEEKALPEQILRSPACISTYILFRAATNYDWRKKKRQNKHNN